MIMTLMMGAAIPATDRNEALERCAEAVMVLRHPGGMVDVTGIRFEWLQVSTAGADRVIIGAIVEREQGAEVARRFTCKSHGNGSPRVKFGKVSRL